MAELKTSAEIEAARDAVCNQLRRRDLTEMQRAIMSGMSVALQWVAGGGGDTLQRLLDGEKVQGKGG